MLESLYIFHYTRNSICLYMFLHVIRCWSVRTKSSLGRKSSNRRLWTRRCSRRPLCISPYLYFFILLNRQGYHFRQANNSSFVLYLLFLIFVQFPGQETLKGCYQPGKAKPYFLSNLFLLPLLLSPLLRDESPGWVYKYIIEEKIQANTPKIYIEK